MRTHETPPTARIFEGPLPNPELTDEEIATIDKMLASDDDLYVAYGEVYKESCFVTEIGQGPNGIFVACVGDKRNIDTLELRLGEEIDTNKLRPGDLMELGAYADTGDTRPESVRNALRTFLEARNKKIK